MRNRVVCGIMITLLLISMLMLTFNVQQVKGESRTWTVDDDGPADFTTIQAAIDSPQVTDGDTVYVYNGTYYESVVLSKSLWLIGESSSNTIINGGRRAIHVTARKANITGVTLMCATRGIELNGNDNRIFGNIIAGNTDGILVYESHNNSIYENRVTGNGQSGIHLMHACNNTISMNNIVANGGGLYLEYDSDGNMIWGNNITDHESWAGVEVEFSSHNTLRQNKIMNNEWGIELSAYSNNNSVYENQIENNYDGATIDYTYYNMFYHNNFIDNTRQARLYKSFNVTWDKDFPSGGNYWSDYEERYPDAEEMDDSGIWDTPYVIDEDNQDDYPLMEPWSPTSSIPTTVDELETEIEELGSEGGIDNQGTVKSLIAKLNVAQKLVNKGKIHEAKSILEEDFIPQVQNLTDIHITPEAADILIQSAEYIISHL